MRISIVCFFFSLFVAEALFRVGVGQGKRYMEGLEKIADSYARTDVQNCISVAEWTYRSIGKVFKTYEGLFECQIFKRRAGSQTCPFR